MNFVEMRVVDMQTLLRRQSLSALSGVIVVDMNLLICFETRS